MLRRRPARATKSSFAGRRSQIQVKMPTALASLILEAMKPILLSLSLGVLAVGLSGCVIAMGNRDLGGPRPTQATVGQQLIDLKKAHDAGAMSDAEYEAQKQKVLKDQPKQK
jgi:hypothetical protein